MNHADILAHLTAVIESRKSASADSSYVASLFARGRSRILQKVGEEAVELVIAGTGEADAKVISECADLWFHTLVLLAERGLTATDVLAELARREGKSGLEEKAGRSHAAFETWMAASPDAPPISGDELQP